MTGSILGIGPAERRPAWTGFALLMVVIAGHTVLETARDALFLRDLPATRLPWAYLAIACASFLLALPSGSRPRLSHRRALQLTLGTGAVITAAFAAVTAQATLLVLLALYVWAGVLVSLAVMHVWLFLSELVDLAQAKRIYVVVAAGGLAGAAVGGVIAAAVVHVWPARALLLVAAGLYVVAAIVPTFVRGAPVPATTRQGARPALDAPVTASGLGEILRTDPYVRRVVLVAGLPPLVFTAVDYLFKSAVSHHVAPDALAPFFARYNAVVYALALVVHLAVASRLLRALGVIRGLMVLPACVLPGAALLAATGAFAAALALKGADIALRHSLYRASTEILFLPMEPRRRASAKAAADGFMQRSGQALASLGLLAAQRDVGLTAVGGAVVALCAVWLLALVGLRRQYVAQFRAQLGELQRDASATVPELDLSALEALVGALGSPNDAEVLAALDILAEYDKSRLVPPLILYHPSPVVVRRAFELFDRSPRDDVRAIQRRLLDHADASIRAAALRNVGSRDLEPERLWRIVQTDPSPEVRATALAIVLAKRPDVGDDDVRRTVRTVLETWPASARTALAQTLPTLPRRIAVHLAHELVDDTAAPVQRELARAVAGVADPALADVCLSLLAGSTSREPAREALLALGEPALDVLERALLDPETPERVRLHVPRTVSRFASPRAAALLSDALARERDPRVRYKILRGLGRLRAEHPSLAVPEPPLLSEAHDSLARALASVQFAAAYAVQRDVRGRTPAPDDLLARLLREKEWRALERVFRILQILEPGEHYRAMFVGLGSRDPHLRATSRELFEHVTLEPALRDAILAVTEAGTPVDRLARVLPWVRDPEASRLVELATAVATNGDREGLRAAALATADAALAVMLEDRDPVLAAVAEVTLGATVDASATPVPAVTDQGAADGGSGSA